MLDSIFTAASAGLSITDMLICTGASLIVGLVIACVYMYKNRYSKNFVVTLALLPVIVQAVIMLVNGNLGVGVAVMGAFNLVRFRSAPGTAKEISSIFFAMAVGLAVGMGYVVYALLFTLIVGLVMIVYNKVRFGEGKTASRILRMTIPEDLDYTQVFAEVFAQYAKSVSLDKVATTNLGSLYELQYSVVLQNERLEKEFIDQMRQRNGNLRIICTRMYLEKTEL